MAPELADVARSVIDTNSYMALGTADGAGDPWVSPVWCLRGLPQLPLGLIAGRQALAEPRRPPGGCDRDLDSSVPVGGAQAVYMKGVAKQLMGAELEQGLEVFDRVSRQDIGRAFGLNDVQGSALFRLYRATVSEHWVLIRAGIQTVARGSTAASACRSSKAKRSKTHRKQPRTGRHAALLQLHLPDAVGPARRRRWLGSRPAGGRWWRCAVGRPSSARPTIRPSLFER